MTMGPVMTSNQEDVALMARLDPVVTLGGVKAGGANLSGTNLENANLENALGSVKAGGANLSGWFKHMLTTENTGAHRCNIQY
jgi:uncharacterized protein YjbI with pentapeptide repeats